MFFSFVATELGLSQTNNGYYVIPRILAGIVDAGTFAHKMDLERHAEADLVINDPESNVESIDRARRD